MTTESEDRQPDRRRPSPEEIGTLTEILTAINHTNEALERTTQRIADFTTTGEVNKQVADLKKQFGVIIVSVCLAFLLLLGLLAFSSHRQAVRVCDTASENRDALRSVITISFQPRPDYDAETLKRLNVFRNQLLDIVPPVECDVPWFQI